MNKTELRALATELLATLDRYQHLLDKTWHPDHPGAVEREKELTAGSCLLDRARAELAVPEAEPPTDEEWQNLFNNIRKPIYGKTLASDHFEEILGYESVRPGDFARAVLRICS